MKKITKLSTIIFILISLINLTSCKEHQHIFDEGRIIQEPICIAEGIKEYKCTKCDETRQETINKLEHNYVNGKCNNCKGYEPNYVDENVSEGLIFELNKDGKSYSLTKMGTCTDTDIIIPSTYKGLPVTSIKEEAFLWCPNTVVGIFIPNSVTSIGNAAFHECIGLKGIVIPSSVTSIGEEVFRLCLSLTNINVDSDNQYYKSINGNLYSKDGTKLIQYANGKKDASFVVPNTVTTIGFAAFANSMNLINIDIPNNVTSIGDSAFVGCENLESIVIPNSVTSIGDWVFVWCKSLKSITIPNSVTSIGEKAFYKCTSLTSIEIPNSVTSIGAEAFNDCISLTSIEIPNSVTSIGNSAFYDCDNLKSVIFKEDSKLTSIGDNAFHLCTSLTSIEIPSSVTNIGGSAFLGCTSLTKIVIPNSVRDIGVFSFGNCPNLTIYCEVYEKPGRWDSWWNLDDCPVVWGYENK